MSNVLVTVAIATYNSSKFIVEALDSAKIQTYPNIELVVSDDCSTDNTIEVIEDWLENPQNRNRFIGVKLLKVPSNTGVSANCNRIFNQSSGEYVKLLAGDDILLPNCIEFNLNFISTKPDAQIIFSQVGIFSDHYVVNQFEEIKPVSIPMNLMDPVFDARKQHQLLLESDRITYTPSVFFRRLTVLNVGGFDESIRMIEDYPMWLKLTSSNIQLFYFNKVTVAYRRHSGALNYKNKETIFQPSVSVVFQIRKKYVFPHFSFTKKYAEVYEFFWMKIFINLRLNNTKYKTFFIFLTKYCNPFWLVNRVFGV